MTSGYAKRLLLVEIKENMFNDWRILKRLSTDMEVSTYKQHCVTHMQAQAHTKI